MWTFAFRGANQEIGVPREGIGPSIGGVRSAEEKQAALWAREPDEFGTTATTWGKNSPTLTKRGRGTRETSSSWAEGVTRLVRSPPGLKPLKRTLRCRGVETPRFHRGILSARCEGEP